jgi:hypothetical protein
VTICPKIRAMKKRLRLLLALALGLLFASVTTSDGLG